MILTLTTQTLGLSAWSDPHSNFDSAVEAENLPAIKKMIAQNPGFVNSKDRDGNYPLHTITDMVVQMPTDQKTMKWRKFQKDLVTLLLESGAVVDVRDASNNTALHNAARNGHLRLAIILRKKGADIEARNDDGETPLFVGIRSGTGMVQYLIASDAKVDITNKAGISLIKIVQDERLPRALKKLIKDIAQQQKEEEELGL